jgi:ATP sulfurylase
MRRDGEYSGTDMAEFHVNNSQVHRIVEEKNLNSSYSYPLTFEVSWVWSLAAGDVCNLEYWTNASSSVISGYGDARYANNWTGTLIQET